MHVRCSQVFLPILLKMSFTNQFVLSQIEQNGLKQTAVWLKQEGSLTNVSVSTNTKAFEKCLECPLERSKNLSKNKHPTSGATRYEEFMSS